jgi:hypothetical protein
MNDYLTEDKIVGKLVSRKTPGKIASTNTTNEIVDALNYQTESNGTPSQPMMTGGRAFPVNLSDPAGDPLTFTVHTLDGDLIGEEIEIWLGTPDDSTDKALACFSPVGDLLLILGGGGAEDMGLKQGQIHQMVEDHVPGWDLFRFGTV